MKTISLAILALALSACASQPKMTPFEAKQAHAAQLSSPVICYVIYAGNQDDKLAGAAELEKRGFACKEQDVRDGMQHWQQIQTERAQMQAQEASRRASRADAAFGLGLMLLSQPPPPRPIQCTTTRFGQTTCW